MGFRGNRPSGWGFWVKILNLCQNPWRPGLLDTELQGCWERKLVMAGGSWLFLLGSPSPCYVLSFLDLKEVQACRICCWLRGQGRETNWPVARPVSDPSLVSQSGLCGSKRPSRTAQWFCFLWASVLSVMTSLLPPIPRQLQPSVFEQLVIPQQAAPLLLCDSGALYSRAWGAGQLLGRRPPLI